MKHDMMHDMIRTTNAGSIESALKNYVETTNLISVSSQPRIRRINLLYCLQN